MGPEETLLGSQRRAWADKFAVEAEVGDFVESALAAVMPSEEEMPFCVRVSAKVLGNDGSVAGVALNACTMALQDAQEQIHQQYHFHKQQLLLVFY